MSQEQGSPRSSLAVARAERSVGLFFALGSPAVFIEYGAVNGVSAGVLGLVLLGGSVREYRRLRRNNRR